MTQPATEKYVDGKRAGAVIKFQLEYMLSMITCGRLDEAQASLEKAIEHCKKLEKKEVYLD